MTEHSTITDLAATLKANWPTVTVAAAWLATKLRIAWHSAFDLAEYLAAHGGLFRYVGKVFYNKEGGK